MGEQRSYLNDRERIPIAFKANTATSWWRRLRDSRRGGSVRSETVYLGSSRERLPHSVFALLRLDPAVGIMVSMAAACFLVIEVVWYPDGPLIKGCCAGGCTAVGRDECFLFLLEQVSPDAVPAPVVIAGATAHLGRGVHLLTLRADPAADQHEG
jgi:hypothetical protein